MSFVLNNSHRFTVNTKRRNSSVILHSVHEFIIENIDTSFGLNDFEHLTHLSKFALARHFHRCYGVPPMRWVWNFRIHLSNRIIRLYPKIPLTEVATLCGFNSSAHFSRAFRDTYRISPSQMRKEYAKNQWLAQDDMDFETFKMVEYSSYIASYFFNQGVN